MNKCNIKVGDYVETITGNIGVVEEVVGDGFTYRIKLSNSNDYIKNVKYFFPIGSACNFKQFKRIGVNDFTKKKKFGPIEAFSDLDVVESIYDKFNELIDHVNTIQEKLNNLE